MDDRIQRALDGELPADALTPAEQAELHLYRASIGTALEPMRRLPAIDVTAEVMRRASPRPSPARRALAAAAGWLWSPRSLTFRPAYALAGTMAVVAVVSTSLMQPATPAGTALAQAGAQPVQVVVQFRLGDSDAREVSLAGDFNDWRPDHQLRQTQPGVWSVDVALAPGVYNYVFIVDGKAWRLDPLAPRVTDGFGGASSRLSVLAPAVRS
jgi:hypothetical protein